MYSILDHVSTLSSTSVHVTTMRQSIKSPGLQIGASQLTVTKLRKRKEFHIFVRDISGNLYLNQMYSILVHVSTLSSTSVHVTTIRQSIKSPGLQIGALQLLRREHTSTKL